MFFLKFAAAFYSFVFISFIQAMNDFRYAIGHKLIDHLRQNVYIYILMLNGACKYCLLRNYKGFYTYY